MANVDRAVGLIPVGHNSGGTPQRTSEYEIADGYATNIFTGDLVKSSGNGKEVQQAAATDRAVGVFAGCEYVDSTGAVQFRSYWPASTAVLSGTKPKAFVNDDPSTVFEIQASGALAEADIRAMADVVVGTGSTAIGTSAMELDSASIAASAKQLKILGLSQRGDNDYGTNAKVRVIISKHELAGAATAA